MQTKMNKTRLRGAGRKNESGIKRSRKRQERHPCGASTAGIKGIFRTEEHQDLVVDGTLVRNLQDDIGGAGTVVPVGMCVVIAHD